MDAEATNAKNCSLLGRSLSPTGKRGENIIEEGPDKPIVNEEGKMNKLNRLDGYSS